MDPTSQTPPVALIPAAGHATRLGRISSSKEILPLGTALDPATGSERPKAVVEYLLESLARAGIGHGLLVTRPDKTDIAAHLSALPTGGVALTILELDESPSVPHTLDRAYAEIRGGRVALGFPDILLQPDDAFRRVADLQATTGADLALGLFPTGQPWKADMVRLDDSGRVRGLAIKQPAGTSTEDLRYTWSVAVWGPAFTELLHRFVGELGPTGRLPDLGREAYVGDVVVRALEEGLRIEATAFPDGDSLDIGTPEDLQRARLRMARI